MYILHSEKLDKYYIGACKDLDRRFYEHNIGHSKFTSLGTPWMLVHKEEYEDIILAKKSEREIKLKKIQKIYRSTGQGSPPVDHPDFNRDGHEAGQWSVGRSFRLRKAWRPGAVLCPYRRRKTSASSLPKAARAFLLSLS